MLLCSQSIIIAIAAPLLFFFGKYTWSNPDFKFCYYDQEASAASLTPTGSGESNIADLWHKWFYFNFISVAVIGLFTSIGTLQLVFECDYCQN